jgi:hypothetical protein
VNATEQTNVLLNATVIGALVLLVLGALLSLRELARDSRARRTIASVRQRQDESLTALIDAIQTPAQDWPEPVLAAAAAVIAAAADLAVEALARLLTPVALLDVSQTASGKQVNPARQVADALALAQRALAMAEQGIKAPTASKEPAPPELASGDNLTRLRALLELWALSVPRASSGTP